MSVYVEVFLHGICYAHKSTSLYHQYIVIAV